MIYTVEKKSNMIFLSAMAVTYKAWDESEFTLKKLFNAYEKIRKCDPNAYMVISEEVK